MDSGNSMGGDSGRELILLIGSRGHGRDLADTG
jgi:hypothetical protein